MMPDLCKARIRSHSAAGLSCHLPVDPMRETWASLEFAGTLDRVRREGKHRRNRRMVNRPLLSFVTGIWMFLELHCQGLEGYPKDSMGLESSIPKCPNRKERLV
jgi:hypothetical protein